MRAIYDRTNGDFLIGIFRLAKAVLLLAVSGGALSLLDAKFAARAQNFVSQLTGDSHFRLTRKIASYLGIPTRQRLEFIGTASLIYGLMFGIQGVGLLYRERWAEYFTAIATASFLPIELYGSFRKPDLVRIAVLSLNIAIVVYLVLQLR